VARADLTASAASAAGAVVGVAALVVGWVLASGEVEAADQGPGLAVAVGGLLVAGLPAVQALGRRRAEVAARRRAVLADLQAALGARRAAPPRPVRPVVVPGGSWWHLPDCLLVAGKPARPATAAVRRARPACPVCQPRAATSARGVGGRSCTT
jgi:hypothetical protein